MNNLDNRKTIFLVDDEMTNLVLGKKVLSEAYNVFAISSGQGLFEMLENILPDLILLDINMPDMNGFDAIRVLKGSERTAAIPVIFLTASGDEEMELKGLSMGATDYITKPFSAPLLLKRIEIHLLLEAQKQELLAQKQQLLFFNNNLARMVKEKTATVVELKNAILTTMAELVEHRDEISGGHINRVQRYIELLLAAMKKHGIYEREVTALDEELVLQSCQLHDVGKIAVRDSILFKPARLTPAEFDEMKMHTTFGEKVILSIKDKTMDSDFLEYARIFAISHHEKWDGSGYPYGLKGVGIPLLGRIMAIADVYDAFISERPYKKAYPHEQAVEIIKHDSGAHFDPEIARMFLAAQDEFRVVSLSREKQNRPAV